MAAPKEPEKKENIVTNPATQMIIKKETDNITFSTNPLGRLVMPEEIANMAVFLVSEMGRSIIGDIVYMTGGSGLVTLDDVKYSF